MSEGGQLMTGWHPIETAPRDGTEILVCEEDCIAVAAIVAGYDFFAVRGEFPIEPTHWMPLPELPMSPNK